ncbi:hypothetical protein Ae706Ps2_3154c [Pseudonocardia sp. Ae706_Ps2]|nr:hypothetical protein Ae331Ps2_2762 [Pseudonocardia sp. Ae331_Ps2]OLM11960.1 hypothetical protein Ae505Ps2_2086 [Pseudonocardia sp. Ae505_Ps2]OLM24721.1 hypothetical protein Ae706Ps2_3154c [Pseudonocardia sp. Ae706_Ps2]
MQRRQRVIRAVGDRTAGAREAGACLRSSAAPTVSEGNR